MYWKKAVAALRIVFRMVTKKFNYIKSNKETTWIYQCYKKIAPIHEILQNFFFFTSKVKVKNRLIRNKVEIGNWKLKMLKWEQ